MRGEGEVNGKNSAAAGVFAGDDFAALGDHETSDDREAEAEATRAGSVAALEFLEEAFAHRGRQAGAAVGDGEKNAGAGGVHAGGEEDGGAGRGVEGGVEEEVGDDLLHERGVGAEEGHVGGDGSFQCVAGEGFADAVEGGVDEVVGVAPVEAGF